MSRKDTNSTTTAGEQEEIPEFLAEELRAYPSEKAMPAPDVDEAILAMAKEKFAAMRSESHRPRRNFYVWPLAAAAACAIFALAWFVKPDTQAPVASVPKRPDYSLILKEVSQVFPGQLRSISTDGESLAIELVDEPVHEARQAIVIQLNDNQKITGVITYIGQTVELDDRQFTVRLDANGQIYIDGGEYKGALGEPIRIALNKIITTETI